MKEELQQALMAVKHGQEERARSILAQLLKEQPDNVAGWILLSKLAQTEVQKVAFLRKVLELDPDNEYAMVEMGVLEGDEEEGEEATEPVLVEVEKEETSTELSAAATGDMAARPEPIPEGDGLERSPEEALPPAEKPAAETTVAAPATELPAQQVEEAEETELEVPPTPRSLPVSESPLDYGAQAEGDTLPPWLSEDEAILEQMAAEQREGEEETPPPADVPEWLQEEPEEEWAGEEVATVQATPEADVVRATDEREAGDAIAKKRAPATVAKATSGLSSAVLIGLGVLMVVIFLLLVYVVLSLF